jgi:hypothetical protein
VVGIDDLGVWDGLALARFDFFVKRFARLAPVVASPDEGWRRQVCDSTPFFLFLFLFLFLVWHTVWHTVPQTVTGTV